MSNIKTFILAVTLLIPALVFSQTSETRSVSTFSKIKVGGSFDTHIKSGDKESVRIEAEESVILKIQTTVTNGVLKVFVDPKNRENIKARVYITCKTLRGIDRAGSGNLICKSDISATDIQLTSSGSGDMEIRGKVDATEDLKVSLSGSGDLVIAALNAEHLELSLAGSGDIQIASGRVKKQSLGIAGSGDIDASGLLSEECSVTIAGSGDANITANKTLEASIAGSGEVINNGTGVLSRSKIAGSGRVRKN